MKSTVISPIFQKRYYKQESQLYLRLYPFLRILEVPLPLLHPHRAGLLQQNNLFGIQGFSRKITLVFVGLLQVERVISIVEIVGLFQN